MITIKVLGSGCPNCKRVEALSHQAADALKLDVEVIKVTDYNQILDYNILSTPGLVINEKVVCSGQSLLWKKSRPGYRTPRRLLLNGNLAFSKEKCKPIFDKFTIRKY